MTSRVKPRLQVVGTFARACGIHSCVACGPYIVSLIFAESFFGKRASLVQLGTMLFLPVTLFICGGVYYHTFKDVVNKYLDLTNVPVALAREDISRHFRFMWPMTLLVSAGSCFSLYMLQYDFQDTGSRMGYLFWTLNLPIGLMFVGVCIQWVLLRLFAPSQHEMFLKMSEAMEAGVKSSKPSKGPPVEPEVETLPFDRPPV